MGAEGVFSMAEWDKLVAVRSEVSRQLEAMRKTSEIGSSLDAEVQLYCDEELAALLSKLGDELRFILITSYANVSPISEKPATAVDTEIAGLALLAHASEYPKCDRCWHHREDVGSHADHPALCGRCVENVDGNGEQRLYG